MRPIELSEQTIAQRGRGLIKVGIPVCPEIGVFEAHRDRAVPGFVRNKNDTHTVRTITQSERALNMAASDLNDLSVVFTGDSLVQSVRAQITPGSMTEIRKSGGRGNRQLFRSWRELGIERHALDIFTMQPPLTDRDQMAMPDNAVVTDEGLTRFLDQHPLTAEQHKAYFGK